MENNIKKDKPKNKGNSQVLIMTYIFVGLFVLLIGNYAYFLIVDSNTVINNPYNARQDLLAERIVRGKIMASNGEVLAETKTDKNGQETRYYPYKSLFCHVVGRFSKGKTGIESSESFTMLASNGNPFGNLINELSGVKNVGDNVITTLDVDLQQVASDALGKRKGAIVVLEPSTGKILAMVSKPTYNPNKIISNWDDLVEDSDNNSALINRATQGLYPPGSTFKILTALEYIRENPNYKKYDYNCDGSDTFQGVKIKCYNNKKHGEETLKKSFAKSCNVSFANIGMKLDIKSFRQLCETFLFNKKLPTDLIYNQSSFELTANSNRSEIPQTAIGQGNTQISPFHNALITAVIANGGTLMNPYVVDRVETTDGNIVKKHMPTTYGTILSSEEAKIIKSFMKEVVEDGSATALKGLSYSVAGKTGSAEFDSNNNSHAWFVGFAPVSQPKIVVSIIVEGAGTGSEYAVPIAKKIFDAYLK